MIGIWEEEEVKALFSEVEKCKGENKPIKEAFLLHAQHFARKPNSVRNYYYHEIDNLSKDEERRKNLGIDLSLHEKGNIVYFSKEEEENLMKEIDAMRERGMSVRKACLSLAGGDVDKLLRYQNKYRNHLAKSKPSEKVSDNVIAFKKPSKGLSDSEVQSLFMGLVRLVKKNATLEGEERYKEKLSQANAQLRKAITQLQSQAREIEQIKERYIQLKKENSSLARSLVLSRCDKASKLREKLKQRLENNQELMGE
ncbi:MAG: hypothetical protein IJZ62_05030 [Clostridia bacterium]|nr:hypothetical protein [Clostridia bacterium]